MHESNNGNLSFQTVATSLTISVQLLSLQEVLDGSVAADIGCPAFLE